VPSSGFLPLSTVRAAITDRASPSRSTSVSVAPQRFAALFHAARVPGVALQSFPFPRSRARSRRPLLPCGFAFDRRQARRIGLFAVLSPPSRPFATTHPKAGRTHGPGRRFLATGGRVRRARRGASTATSLLDSSGSPVSGRHAHFEALLSSRVRSRGDPRPGQGEVVGSVLSWASVPSRAFSSRTSGSVCRRDVRGAGKPACLVRPRERSRLVSFTRPVLRSWGLAPRIRRRARSIEPRMPPSGGDPAGGAFAAHRRQSPAPVAPGRRREAESPHATGASCPRPLSAAPRASHALDPHGPVTGTRGRASETLV